MSMYYWGDPDRALALKEADDYRYEKSLPVCHKCKEPIADDYLYEVDGWDYCESCFHEKFRISDEELDKCSELPCEECGKNLAGEFDWDAHRVEGTALCGECADKLYRTRNLIYGIA